MNCVVDISNWLFSPSQITCYDVQSCLAFSEEHRWHSCFLRGHCLGSFNLSCQQRNPQVIESQTWVCWDTYKTVYSNGPILCRYLVATSKASMRSVNRDRGSGAWVWGPETKPTLPLKIITKRCLLFPCAKRNPRKLIASKYQYHASVYILQTVGPMLLFYYQIRRKRNNAADPNKPGWAGNPMSAGANSQSAR